MAAKETMSLFELVHLVGSLGSVQEKWWVLYCVVHHCIYGLCSLLYLPNKDSVFKGVPLILNIATYSVVRDEITALIYLNDF